MTEALGDGALFDLMTWMSPAWPIGAFAYSSGVEWAVDQGFVTDRASAAHWLATLLRQGPIHNDVVIFVHAWRAASDGDGARLHEVAELAIAAQTGYERRLEATAQGAAFRRIAIDSLDPPRSRGGGGASAPTEGAVGLALDHNAALTRRRPPPPAARAVPLPVNGGDFSAFLAPIADADLTYPVAAATLFATQGIALHQALTAYLHGAIANLVSAAQRLVPLGQTDAQRVLRDLRPAILAAVDAAGELADDDPFEAFAGSALLADLGCMAHETQYTRLFRT